MGMGHVLGGSIVDVGIDGDALESCEAGIRSDSHLRSAKGVELNTTWPSHEQLISHGPQMIFPSSNYSLKRRKLSE
jgi:hypothetical protein